MKTIKVSLKNYTAKNGTSFTKITAKGKYIPLAQCELETKYTIKLCSNPAFKTPTRDGFYTLAVEDCWVDTRADYIDKNIVRVKPIRMVFEGNFPNNPTEENK